MINPSENDHENNCCCNVTATCIGRRWIVGMVESMCLVCVLVVIYPDGHNFNWPWKGFWRIIQFVIKVVVGIINIHFPMWGPGNEQKKMFASVSSRGFCVNNWAIWWYLTPFQSKLNTVEMTWWCFSWVFHICNKWGSHPQKRSIH